MFVTWGEPSRTADVRPRRVRIRAPPLVVHTRHWNPLTWGLCLVASLTGLAGCGVDPAPTGTDGAGRPGLARAAGPPNHFQFYNILFMYPLGVPTRSPIGVQVLDSAGIAISGLKVSSLVDSGGGVIETLPNPDPTLAGDPIFASWLLGDSLMRQVAHVEAGGIRSENLVVLGTVGKVTLVSGGGQQGRPGGAVPDPVVVQAATATGKRLGAGFAVFFRPLDTLAQVKASHSVLTDDQGLATQAVPWILEAKPGLNTMLVQGKFAQVQIQVHAEGVAPKPERTREPDRAVHRVRDADRPPGRDPGLAGGQRRHRDPARAGGPSLRRRWGAARGGADR